MADGRGSKTKAVGPPEPEAEAPRKAQRSGAPEPEEGSSQQEDPAPAPAPAAPDASTISDRRLQIEVQALLATKVEDLGQVTVGQMRTQLEQRLGLDGGALGARKQLRRRVSRVLQDEVVKKTGRSADCERVVRALVEFEAYPAEVRQMLIEGLPHALAAVVPQAARQAPAQEQGEPQDEGVETKAASDKGQCRLLHSHQVRLLGIVRDALGEAREQAANAEIAAAARVKAAEAALSACQGICASATAAVIAVQAQCESAEARARNLENEVEHAKSHLSSAEACVQGANDQVAALQSKRNIAEVLRDGPLQTLLHGTWKNEKESHAAVSALLPYLTEESADDALLAAAPATLRKRPNERSAFDALTVQSVKEFVAERIGAMDSQLAAGMESAADADRLAAAAMLRATRARADDQASKAAAARSTVEEAVLARQVAEAAVAQHRTGMIDLFSELELLRSKVEELEKVLATLDTWIDSRRPDGSHAASVGSAEVLSGDAQTADATMVADAEVASSDVQTADATVAADAEVASGDLKTADAAVDANDATSVCHAQAAEQSPPNLDDSVEQSPPALDDRAECLPSPAKVQAAMCIPASPQKIGCGGSLGVESEDTSPARLRHIATPTRSAQDHGA